jgi:RNA polymerase sigma factor (sigma-70 family)
MQIDTITAAATTEEDALLLGRVAAGDVGGPLVDLYRRYSARLYGLGLKLLGERGMAEELVQETFVRLWRSAGRYDPERGSVRTFLFAIARRVAADLLRRSASRPLSSQEHVELVDDRSFDSLLVSLDVRDALEALRSIWPTASGAARPPRSWRERQGCLRARLPRPRRRPAWSCAPWRPCGRPPAWTRVRPGARPGRPASRAAGSGSGWPSAAASPQCW